MPHKLQRKAEFPWQSVWTESICSIKTGAIGHQELGLSSAKRLQAATDPAHPARELKFLNSSESHIEEFMAHAPSLLYWWVIDFQCQIHWMKEHLLGCVRRAVLRGDRVVRLNVLGMKYLSFMWTDPTHPRKGWQENLSAAWAWDALLLPCWGTSELQDLFLILKLSASNSLSTATVLRHQTSLPHYHPADQLLWDISVFITLWAYYPNEHLGCVSLENQTQYPDSWL